MESKVQQASAIEETAEKNNYSKPETEKHEPVKIVQGSGSSCGSLYYTTLYYY